MPNTKQKAKRMRQAEKRHLRNISRKTEIKTNIKNFDAALQRGDREDCEVYLNRAVKALDKASSSGVIQKNRAAQKKSSLMRKFNRAF